MPDRGLAGLASSSIPGCVKFVQVKKFWLYLKVKELVKSNNLYICSRKYVRLFLC